MNAYLLRDVEGPEVDLEVWLGRDVAGDGPHGARGPRGSERRPRRAGEHLEMCCVWWLGGVVKREVRLSGVL